MVAAFTRLAVITIFTIILTILALFGVRQIGLTQSVSTPPHPWFEREFWWVLDLTPQQLCFGTELGTVAGDVPWIVAIPITFNAGEWQSPCPTYKANLVKFLEETPGRLDWLLQIEHTGTENLDALIEKLAPFDKTHRFGIFSTSQKVARYMRKKAPQWLYAADTASLVRFQLFTSLWIETAMEFWPDFVIPPPPSQNEFQISERIAAELKRRHKKIVWKDTPRYPWPAPVEIQGIMTNRPSEALLKFAKP